MAIALGLMLCGIAHQASAGPVVMTAPENYQVMALSPNGKWACGTYVDYSNAQYAFRWNLESGTVELLSTTSESSAWGVADDGTVSGTFSDTEVYPNGVPVEMAGYYKDGSWHHLELPEGVDGDGMGYAITPDGHYMSGVVTVNGKYNPYIWKDGKIYRNLSNGYDGMPYAISPDGQAAAGWVYTRKGGNRTAVYWRADGELVKLSNYESPWSSGRVFSSDGKKLLFWGGWQNDTDMLAAIYDTTTGEVTSLPTCVAEPDFDIFWINNNGTVVGDESKMGYIYIGGKAMYLTDWLAEKGIDLSSEDILTIRRASVISDDENIVGFLYYDTEGAFKSMVLKLDAGSRMPPVELTAAQMPGTKTVALAWKAPYGIDGLQGYNVYRDGSRLNDEPISALNYYDQTDGYGTYTYAVAAVYAGEELSTDNISVTTAPQQLSVPQSLFLRQKGVNSILAQWETPASNLITRNYYSLETAYTTGFGTTRDGVTFEVAVKFGKDDIACYTGCRLSEVAFYPMSEQQGWAVNIYTRTDDGTLQLIKSQPVTQQLVYQKRNVVKIDQPVDIPDGELIVAVQATVASANESVVGMDFGHCEKGYSDLIRMSTEDDFYSLYDNAVEMGYSYPTVWMVDVILTPEGMSDDADRIEHYNVYADGQKLGETADQAYIVRGLADGTHTIGVDAVYASGTSATVEKSQTVAARYVAVDKAFIDVEGSTGLHARWLEPTDNDVTYQSYAIGDKLSYGPKSVDNGLMAGVLYTPQMLKGYDGYKVQSVSFYPITDALFTIIITENDKQIYELEVDDYVPNQLNTITLPQPVTINERSQYRLVIDCFDVATSTAPLAIDLNTGFKNYSDLYSLTGESWSSFSDTGLNGNWMIGWTLCAPDAQPLDVEGYDVRIDGTKMNGERLTSPEFIHNFDTDDGNEHQLCVDVYYPGVSESVKGAANYFHIGVSGIDGASVPTFRMHGTQSYLCVDGEGVEQVSAYNMAGTAVASVKGNTIDISGLASGVYIVKVKVGGKDVVRKIEIRK